MSQKDHKVKPSEMSFSLGKPMTYEEMMADRAKSRGMEPSVVPVSIPELTRTNQPITLTANPMRTEGHQETTPRTIVGRDGTLYNLEQMKARRDRKNT